MRGDDSEWRHGDDQKRHAPSVRPVNRTSGQAVVDRARKVKAQCERKRQRIDPVQQASKRREEEELRRHQDEALVCLCILAESQTEVDEDSEKRHLAERNRQQTVLIWKGEASPLTRLAKRDCRSEDDDT